MKNKSKTILVYGECVIDIHENFEVVAGAPLHVAINLKKSGFSPFLVSAVGNDANGKRILKLLKKFRISNKYIDIKNKLKTGLAFVKTKNNENIFKVDKYSAWDEINKIPNFLPDLLYTSSIAFRSNTSLKTLSKILKKKIKYIFFDINLRKPYINWDFIEFLISKKITHLKITKNEYRYIKKKSKNKFLIKNLFKINKKLKFIILTKGKDGAAMYFKNGTIIYDNKTKKPNINNTVGAGDVFSSLMITGILRKDDAIQSFTKAIIASEKSIFKKTSY